MLPLEQVRTSDRLALELHLAAGATEEAAIARATEVLRASPGKAPLLVRWYGAGNGAASSAEEAGHRFRSRSIRVLPSDAVLEELRALFGADHVRLIKT